jgi:hypothetical protein
MIIIDLFHAERTPLINGSALIDAGSNEYCTASSCKSTAMSVHCVVFGEYTNETKRGYGMQSHARKEHVVSKYRRPGNFHRYNISLVKFSRSVIFVAYANVCNTIMY